MITIIITGGTSQERLVLEDAIFAMKLDEDAVFLAYPEDEPPQPALLEVMETATQKQNQKLILVRQMKEVPHDRQPELLASTFPDPGNDCRQEELQGV